MATRVLSFAVILFLVHFPFISAQYCAQNTKSCGQGNVCCHHWCQSGSDCVGKYCSIDSDCLSSETCCGSACWKGLTCSGYSCSSNSDCSTNQVCCKGSCASICDDTAESRSPLSTIIGTIVAVSGFGVTMFFFAALCWCRRRRRVGVCVVNARQPTRIITATSNHTNYCQLPPCPPLQQQNLYHPPPPQYHEVVTPEANQSAYAPPPPYEE